jgi:hypothetical protein
VEGGDGDYSLYGSVSGGGEARVMVSNSMGSAVGYGRLHGSAGGGQWSTSGNECAGSWSASRRGEQPRTVEKSPAELQHRAQEGEW